MGRPGGRPFPPQGRAWQPDFGGRPVPNIGLAGFADDLQRRGVPVVQLDWAPPAKGDPRLAALVARLNADERVAAANREAVGRILKGDPVAIDVRPAREVVPGLRDRMVLHAGPPVAWEKMCGPMRAAVQGACVLEGWAPDLAAAEKLVADGFTVLPYVNADPVLCKRLEEVGCATVMPLGSWIGSNQGLRTRGALEIIVEQARVPVVVDAGLGAPSHAAEAMEIGADAVLVNTAIGTAADPALMAAAFRDAVIAGRTGYLAGLAAARTVADASSPLTGFLDS